MYTQSSDYLRLAVVFALRFACLLTVDDLFCLSSVVLFRSFFFVVTSCTSLRLLTVVLLLALLCGIFVCSKPSGGSGLCGSGYSSN